MQSSVSRSSHDRTGLLWALAGFCTLTIGDAIVKGMAGDWPAPAMVLTRYIVGSIALGALLAWKEGWASLRLPTQGLQWLRGVAISCSAIGMFMGVWIMPLADATTIAFTQPMITAILGIIFLHERARKETWIACAIAFVGVIIVLRPGFAELGWGMLFPLMGATGMAVTLIANRKVAGRASVLAMQYYMSVTGMVFLSFVVLTGHYSGVDQFELHWPHWSVLARCAFIGISACFAQWFIFMGTVRAGAGTVSPMIYGQLLMAVAFGWAFFGDVPDAVSLLGAVVIIGAGLYLWRASRSRSAA